MSTTESLCPRSGQRKDLTRQENGRINLNTWSKIILRCLIVIAIKNFSNSKICVMLSYLSPLSNNIDY